MPKLKTVKSLKRRFKVTGSGKIIHCQVGRRHLLGHKRGKTQRHLRRRRVVAAVDVSMIRTLIPR